MLLPLLRGWVFPQRNYIDYIASHSLTYKPALKYMWCGWQASCAAAARAYYEPDALQPSALRRRTVAPYVSAMAASQRKRVRRQYAWADASHLLLNVIHRAHILYIHRIEFVACKVLVLGNEQCRCLNEYASFLLGKNLLKLCILFFSHVIIK